MNIVVGYLYNQNGMSTWCIEAAKALHSVGHNVLLVRSSDVELADNIDIPFIVFNFWPSTHNKPFHFKFLNRIKKSIRFIPVLFKNNVELIQLDAFIRANNFIPDLYLHNQSNLYNSLIKVPQFIVAWAYKPYFNNYIEKAIKIGKINKHISSEIFKAIAWYNHDRYAYKNTNAILCVTKALQKEVLTISNKAYSVYPSYFKKSNQDNNNFEKNEKIISLCIMALYLDDPRKGVLWMLNAIAKLQNKNIYSITLIGNISDSFKQLISALNISVQYTGFLSRSASIKVLLCQDVLLFGSVIDDWGFVQVEALANGIPVLAPSGNPCDEIIGRADFLYIQNDVDDFQSKICNISNVNLKQISSWFIDRYEKSFSPDIFANCIERIVNSNIQNQPHH